MIVASCMSLVRDESAVTAIEYALLGTLIAVAIIAGVSALGTNLNNLYNTISAAVEAAL